MTQRITLLCGGQSPEHAISLLSAQNVLDGLREAGYETQVVYIDTQGGWFQVSTNSSLSELPQLPTTDPSLVPISLNLGHKEGFFQDADCVFPVLHGPMGEDGTVQGLFTLLDLPYVGPDVLGSSLAMHKALTRDVLTQHGIACVPYRLFHANQRSKDTLLACYHELGPRVFVKPVRAGSSWGVSQATDETSLLQAVEQAFRFDTQIMIEPAIEGREVEVSVLGLLGAYQAAGPGEIVLGDTFYSYAEKYSDSSAAHTVAKADLPEDVAQQIRDTAIQIMTTLTCEGMARVDGYLLPSGTYLFNELNTIPGFTAISLYPQMWHHAGTRLPELLTALVEVAIDRHKREQVVRGTSQEAVA